ncbi:hypothetical protein B9Z55_011743 [Caenorhabditis nigoni]|uniref:Uncharacterized protein n=1 Tax=Caenorhabditis nigoni TaxID=1611254 RepID=A0A2G5ULI7_9PELO|nr:hypothetical protein B9Z55_011743 [Caenorhabditis nigoni]
MGGVMAENLIFSFFFSEPSVNPSTISLQKVDIVPWASLTKNPRQAESIATSSAQNLLETVQNTPTSSESSEDVFRGNQEVEIALLEDVEVMEDGDVQILEVKSDFWLKI